LTGLNRSNIDMNDDTNYLVESLQIFAEESSELLQQSEYILLKLEDKPDSDELINDLFRTIHTIKDQLDYLALTMLFLLLM
jgi:chemotaxis protein histidine kinase CheA